MGEDPRAEHLKGRNASSWVTIFVGPGVILKGYLVVESPGLFLWRVFTICNPPPNVGPIIWMCTGITSTPPVGGGVRGAGLNLGVVEQLEEELGKGPYELARLAWSGRCCFPGPEWLKERATEGPSCRCPIQASQCSLNLLGRESVAGGDGLEECLKCLPLIWREVHHRSAWVDLET